MEIKALTEFFDAIISWFKGTFAVDGLMIGEGDKAFDVSAIFEAIVAFIQKAVTF